MNRCVYRLRQTLSHCCNTNHQKTPLLLGQGRSSLLPPQNNVSNFFFSNVTAAESVWCTRTHKMLEPRETVYTVRMARETEMNSTFAFNETVCLQKQCNYTQPTHLIIRLASDCFERRTYFLGKKGEMFSRPHRLLLTFLPYPFHRFVIWTWVSATYTTAVRAYVSVWCFALYI